VLDLVSLVIGEQLQIRWLFSCNLHRKETIEQIVQHYVSALCELITHCLSPEARGYTPSDFALAAPSQDDLDDLISELDGRK